MDDETKDELMNSEGTEYVENAENTEGSVSAHSDYKPVNRFDAADWWTLQGFKIGRKPTQSGVYIHHGNKVVIK